MPPKKRLMPLAGENLSKFFKRQSASVTEDDRSSSTATTPELAEAVHTANTDSDTSSTSSAGGNDAAVNDNDCGNGTANVTTSAEPKEHVLGKFQQKWRAVYGQWLHYDDDKRIMYCDICRQLKFTNAMAVGTTNLKTTTIQRHVSSDDHQRALLAPQEQNNFQTAVSSALSKEESGIVACMKVVYWMAKEAVPLSKYSSLMELLRELGTPNMDALKFGERVTYGSYNTACDLLNSISKTIDKSVTDKIQRSPVLTVLTDESTDIAVHHKLAISGTVIDPLSMIPSTLFLTDLRITSATGKGIYEAIEKHLEGRNVKMKRVSGK